MINIPLQLYVDGVKTAPDAVSHRLVRSVIISLFTWRRADNGDELPTTQKFGWWGDTHPNIAGDKIGSKLWLLSRGKLTVETIAKAKEYAEQALAWMIEDGVAASVVVITERQGIDRLAMQATISYDSKLVNIRFDDVWAFLR